MGYKRIKKKKFFKKGLPKFQIKGETSQIETDEGIRVDQIMNNPVPPTDEGYTMDEMNVVAPDIIFDPMSMATIEGIRGTGEGIRGTDSPAKLNVAEEVIPVPPVSDDTVTENDIIMAALMNDKKVKFNKDGSIKKIKKTGGIAPGKFLRRGGSIGRKFL